MSVPRGGMSSPASQHSSSVMNNNLPPEKTWTSLAQDLDKALDRLAIGHEKSMTPKPKVATPPNGLPNPGAKDADVPKVEIKFNDPKIVVGSSEQPKGKTLDTVVKNAIVQVVMKSGAMLEGMDDVSVKFSLDVSGSKRTFTVREE